MVVNLRMLILFFIITAASSFAQNIRLSASTDSTEYKVGDYIKYTLELRYDKDIKVNLPSVKDSVKVLEFIQALEPAKNEVDNKVIEKHTYIFSKYDSSQVTIPSYKIFYTVGTDTSKRFLEVNPVAIVVRTLPVDKQADIRDVKEPIKLPLNWLLIGIITFIVLLLLAAGYYLYKYLQKKKQSKFEIRPEIIIPPHETALAELHQLEEKKLWQQGMVKEYHSEITEVVRKYFEGRFDFRALEITSSEILACLSYLEEGKKITNIADNFFNNADLVKFAKFQPMPNVNEEMMKQAYEIVNQTIPETKPVVSIEENKEEANVR